METRGRKSLPEGQRKPPQATVNPAFEHTELQWLKSCQNTLYSAIKLSLLYSSIGYKLKIERWVK